ncbi:hypothetical protein JOB18_049197 [Solea senegalensis]|uniref:Uncharacterized protein n=1 Tax=Solea senegalensis TaxID=28829 RepID=A0AAV6SDC8_SOLSE|nr:hypothetical protein JOB18_049197 [Solea senegalensis]
MDSLEKIDSNTEESDSLTDKLVLVVIKQTMVDIADLKMSLCKWNAQERHVYGDNEDVFKLGPVTKEKADEYLARYFNNQLKATKSLRVHQEDKDTKCSISPSLTSFFERAQMLPPALSKTGRMYKDCKNVMIPETRSSFRYLTGSKQGRKTASPASSSPTVWWKTAYTPSSLTELSTPEMINSRSQAFEETGSLSPAMSENGSTHSSALALSESKGHKENSKKVMIPETRPSCSSSTRSGMNIETIPSFTSPAALTVKGDSENIMISETRLSSKWSTRLGLSRNTPSSLTTYKAMSTPEMAESCSQAFEETHSLTSALSEKEGIFMTLDQKSSSKCSTRSDVSGNTPSPLQTTIAVSEMEDSCQATSLFQALSKKRGHEVSKHRIIPIKRSSSKCSTRSEVRGETAFPASSSPIALSVNPEMENSCSQAYAETYSLSPASLTSSAALTKANYSDLSCFKVLEKQGDSKKVIAPEKPSSNNCSTRSQVRSSPALSLPNTTSASTCDLADSCFQAFEENRSLSQVLLEIKEIHSVSPALSEKEGHEGESKNIVYPEVRSSYNCFTRSEVESKKAFPYSLSTTTRSISTLESPSSCSTRSEVKGITVPSASCSMAKSLSPALLEKVGHYEDSDSVAIQEKRLSSKCSTRSGVSRNTPCPCPTVIVAGSTPEMAESCSHAFEETHGCSLSQKGGHDKDGNIFTISEKRSSSKYSTRSGVSGNTPSPLPTIIAVLEMEDICSQAFEETACSLAISEKGGHDEDRKNVPETRSARLKVGKKTVSPTSTAVPNHKMVDSCSPAFKGTKCLSPVKSDKEGHGRHIENVIIPEIKPSSTKLGSKKTAPPTLPITATLTEATLRSMYPGAADEDLRWFTYRLAHYFIMLEKEGYRDRKNMIFEVRPSSICSTSSELNRKTGSPATATIEITEPTLGRSNTYDCQKQENKQNESVWSKFFRTWRKNKIHPLSQDDQKEDFFTPPSPPCTREDQCQPKNKTAELQSKNKKSVWRKLFHTRRNKIHSLTREDQKKDSCAPQALSPTTVEPCQPKDNIDEKQKKKNKWGKSVWKNFMCLWKKNKIHSLSREDWPPPHHV